MGNVSKLVRDGSNNNVSKLIKAMNGWNETFYTDPPKGVFGSVAIIKCNDAVINSDELDIDFRVPFDDDLEENEAEVTIYNLSDTTLSRLKKGKKITITAGFKGDTGVIFSGIVDKASTTFEGADRKTILKCVDRFSTKTVKEITYASGTKASKILKDLINKTNTPIAVFNVRRDHTYSDEVKVDGSLVDNIKTYSDVCGVSTYVRGGKVYCRYLKTGDNLNFTLTEDTGLIGSPAEYEENLTVEDFNDTITGYECESILQHRFYAGGIVKLQSRNVKGDFRIRSGCHSFSQGTATTSIKVF